MHANDFPAKYRTKNIICNICSRHTGIGADGLLIVSESKHYDFELDYYTMQIIVHSIGLIFDEFVPKQRTMQIFRIKNQITLEALPGITIIQFILF